MDCFVATLRAMTNADGAAGKTLLSRLRRQNRRGARRPFLLGLRPALRPIAGISLCGAIQVPEPFHSTFAASGCSEAAFATRAALAIPARAASFFCGSEPGCTTPQDMIRVAASSALISTSMILLLGT